MTDLQESLQQLLEEKYDEIYLIVSPPRCGSTAFARVFWEHPHIRYYSHEPFETTYYEKKSLDDVYERLQEPLDLTDIKSHHEHFNKQYKGLVIKEMPYQVGKYFQLAQSWAQRPIIFLIRDPRLNIQSRINKKLETGDSPFFPLKETGWELIKEYIDFCKEQEIPYRIVDSSDFRNHPKDIFQQVFKAYDLSFFDEQLQWKADQSIEIDNLGGAHTHLYKKVLGSNTIHPAHETIPSIESFTKENGVYDHVIVCMGIYEELKKDPHCILPSTS